MFNPICLRVFGKAEVSVAACFVVSGRLVDILPVQLVDRTIPVGGRYRLGMVLAMPSWAAADAIGALLNSITGFRSDIAKADLE
jgi:hypothetical protein